jgi:hypothetical protein
VDVKITNTTPSTFTTWYVNGKGGSRYHATDFPQGQCDGTSPDPYPGSGVNLHCAFNDVRYLWTTGHNYCTDPSPTSSCWAWVGKGGDTYVIDCTNGANCRVGPSGPNSGDYFGLPGNPYGAGAPVLHSGTAAQHTRILGVNYASCSPSNYTKVYGGYATNFIFQVSLGAAYVDFACFDMTDHSSCGRNGQVHQCNTNYPLDDYTIACFGWDNTAHDITLTDIDCHGTASVGILGPPGDGVTMKRVRLSGNAGAGWNMDNGTGTTGYGHLNLIDFSVSWNGCAEEYPIVHPLPYTDCADDQVGGYGEGIGTATTSSCPAGWTIVHNGGTVNNNTQDGDDWLHANGCGTNVTVEHVLFYANMGNQVKSGVTETYMNNIIINNTFAMCDEAIPGTPKGYNSRLTSCGRAGNEAFIINVNKGSIARVIGNTFFCSGGHQGGDCGGITSGSCTDGTCGLDFRNNIQLGFVVAPGTELPSRFTDSSGAPGGIFAQAASKISNNVCTGMRGAGCSVSVEKNSIFTTPMIKQTTWALWGFPDVRLGGTGTDISAAGVAIEGMTTNFAGAPRTNPPSIGAY